MLFRSYSDASSTASEYQQQPHRSRSSSQDPRHLTGEMIRHINALQKKGGNAATLAASLADYQRQQLQMQATYERVLRVSSFAPTLDARDRVEKF